MVNTGQVVDQYRLEPLGALAPWTRVEPASLALMPGGTGTASVTFLPPRTSQLPAGEVAWAVRVIPHEDPLGVTVEEGSVQVAAFTEVTAELASRTSRARGRRAATQQLAVDNRGNTTVEIFLSGSDPAQALDVVVSPDHLLINPGTCALATVRPRSRTGLFRGQPTSHPFHVVAEPAGQPPVVVDGSLLQEPVLPSWLLKALLVAAIVAALAVALWATVLKPSIDDSARAIATTQAKAATAHEAKARKAADATAAGRDAASQADTQSQIDGLAAKSGKPTGTGTSSDLSGTPVTTRISTTATDQSPVAVLDPKRSVSVTDLLMQNPEGDSGTISLSRGGEVVYVARLENFRDLDLHLIAPIQVSPGQQFGITVTCTNADPAGKAPAKSCSPAITVQGFAARPR